MHRFFVDKAQLPVIAGPAAHQIRDVLRMKPGEEIELLDGAGKIYSARIIQVEKEKIACEIISSRMDESEPKVKVTLAQALPKGRKMDFIVEKCVELGASQIIPLQTERAIAKAVKIDRWRKIAREAAEQSGRAVIPEIANPMTFEAVLKLRNQYDQALIFWELEREYSLKKHFFDHRITGSPDILALIGPEGGFSQIEVKQAEEAGFISVSLGKRILRTETAGMAVLAAIMYELGSS